MNIDLEALRAALKDSTTATEAERLASIERTLVLLAELSKVVEALLAENKRLKLANLSLEVSNAILLAGLKNGQE